MGYEFFRHTKSDNYSEAIKLLRHDRWSSQLRINNWHSSNNYIK